MKRKLLLSLLAFAGGLTVVGSGFSAWYFNENKTITATGTVKHYVTDLNGNIGELKDLNESKSIYIILDQGGYENADVLTKGVSISHIDDNSSISDSNLGETSDTTIGATYSITEANYTTLKNANINSGTFTATFELSTEAAAYIKFKSEDTYDTSKATLPTGGSFNITDSKVVYTYTINFNDAFVTNSYKQEFKFDASTTDYVNVMLQYVDSKKPTNNSDYTAMKTALNNKTLMSIDYSFDVNKTTA